MCVSSPVLSSSPLQLCHGLMWEPITNVVKGPVSEQVCYDGGGRGGGELGEGEPLSTAILMAPAARCR